MKVFIERVIFDNNLQVCAESGLLGFIPWHSCGAVQRSFLKLELITYLTGSLGNYYNCDGLSHDDDDVVEGICCHENRQQVDTGNERVNSESAQNEPVSTTAGWNSLIFLTINFRKYGG